MCITAESLGSVELEDFMRQKLPDLLRDHGEFRYEIMGILADVFASKDDLKQVLEEIRKLREDSNRRFEEMNRTMNQRFEEMNRTMNQRFEEMYRSQREVRLEVSALGGRIGYGLEEIIRQTVEEFSGQSFKKFEHLRLRDSEGELYGIPADVEYDLYLEDSVNYVVEVKSHIKPGDVLIFHRKSLFAEKQLLKRIKPIMISASITKDAKKKCKELGIDLISRSVVD
jgi:hypothetical protein